MCNDACMYREDGQARSDELELICYRRFSLTHKAKESAMNTASVVSVSASATARFFCAEMPQIVRQGASEEEAVLLFNAIGEWRQAQRKLELAELTLAPVASTGAQDIREASGSIG
jgi:hypothetical protein